MDYNDHMEEIAKVYGPKAFDLLHRIKYQLEVNGFTCVEPYDMSADDYRWSMTATMDGNTEEDYAVDLSVEIAEQRQYEGEDAPWGLNFGLDITFVDGLIIGGLTPYNYTEECWVDSTDSEAVAARWAILDEADVTTIPDLLKSEIARREERANA